MCSSLVAGFAGAHLFNRASSSNSRSTAGFLFCTWAVGLVQTGQQGVLKGAHGFTDVLATVLAIIVLLSGPLLAIQTVWILYLPVERLESLQTTAGHKLIPVPNMKRRVFQFGAVPQL